MTSPTTDAYIALQDRHDGYVLAAEAREEALFERLDAVRANLRTANATIDKLRAELEQFRPVMVFADSRSFVLVKRLDQSPHELGEYVSAPVTLYAKDDHA